MIQGAILTRLVSFALPVAAGAAILFGAIQMRKPPVQAPVTERAQPVRVITVKPAAFVPRVRGYGSVAPVRTWNAVAQVAGRVEYVHPNLDAGALLPKGTEIIRIRPRDYEIAVAQAEANVRAAEARLAELEVQADNTKRSLAIEQRALETRQTDLGRKKDLATRGATSQSVVDEAERAVLAQRARVEDLENAIRLSPIQIQSQRQQIAVSKAELERARFNLGKTRITLPFDARIASISVEETQFAGVGTALATADDISVAEITAQVPQSRFRSFVTTALPADTMMTRRSSERDAALVRRFGWAAEVRLRFDDRDAVWPATVVRTSDTIDPKTRSVGVVVAVDKPYAGVKPVVRPPLVKGMFVAVELSARPLPDQIAIPRSALHDGTVYVAGKEDRLEIRPVEVRVVQGSEVLIAKGLGPGDRVVVSDLAPAIAGMLLKPTVATTNAAKGDGAAR